MIDPQYMAAQILARNPNISSNPQAMAYISAIQSGDFSRVKQIAENICNTYGVSTEQAVADTIRFFGFR